MARGDTKRHSWSIHCAYAAAAREPSNCRTSPSAPDKPFVSLFQGSCSDVASFQEGPCGACRSCVTTVLLFSRAKRNTHRWDQSNEKLKPRRKSALATDVGSIRVGGGGGGGYSSTPRKNPDSSKKNDSQTNCTDQLARTFACLPGCLPTLLLAAIRERNKTIVLVNVHYARPVAACMSCMACICKYTPHTTTTTTTATATATYHSRHLITCTSKTNSTYIPYTCHHLLGTTPVLSHATPATALSLRIMPPPFSVSASVLRCVWAVLSMEQHWWFSGKIGRCHLTQKIF
jgi:hypothetical protein